MPDPQVEISLQSALGLTSPLNVNIHGNDQMFTYSASVRGSTSMARSEYFTSGAQLLKIVEQLVCWKFGSFESVSSFLDFASGYGRLTRFLVQKLPAARIWVSDIQADAVAFQQAEFGVHGFVSSVDPADLVCDRTFDCIFVASLFSHLPPSIFTSWLKKLYSLLRPGGLLIFSVHDESRLLPGNTMPDSGIWYAETSEVASADTKGYGVAFVAESFVRDAILAATGRSAYHRIPGGLVFHQDIYLLLNEPSPDFSGLIFSYLPHGGIDYALWTSSRELRLRGWAADITETGNPVEVQIFVDEQLQQKCAPSDYRPDLLTHFKDDRFLYAGWSCSCHVSSSDPAQLLTAKGVSPGGAESLLYSGTVDSLLPLTSLDTVVTTSEFDERRRQLKVELDRRLEYIRHLEAEVARKEAALAQLESRVRRRPWQRRSPQV